MPDYRLQYVYQISDFSTSGTHIAPPDQSRAQTVGNLPCNIALKSGSLPQQILISDDDPDLKEFGDNGQFLAVSITLDGVTYQVGTKVSINYVITADNGFEGYGISLGQDNNGGNMTTAFVTNNPLTAEQTYTFTAEATLGKNTVPYNQFACFTAGTMIKTERGERPIEDLKVGDRVMTRDHGLQVIRWAGTRTVAGIGNMAPVTFDTGTLGCSAPLTVSPNHRMLITGAMAELVCGDDELLLAAKMLVNYRNVRQIERGFLTYVHIMFDYHEIIWANDCPSESFYIGDNAIGALDDTQAAELLAIFPDLRTSQKEASLARAEGHSYEGTVIAASL